MVSRPNRSIDLARFSEGWDEAFGGRDDYVATVSIFLAERIVSTRIVSVLAEHELSLPQWTMITIVQLAAARGERLSVGEIADALDVHSSTVTNAVVKLEARGWVTRTRADGRTVLIDLTTEGAEMLPGVQKALVGVRFGLGNLSEQAVRTIAELLRPLWEIPADTTAPKRPVTPSARSSTGRPPSRG